ncbi:cationic peroxidase 1 [Quercus suber]|uniref:cationic peroxidase 1 n=1 Tax=Quercus suber TaxID=58331 RepID=UPI0032DFB891
MHQPTTTHWIAIKRILHYLKSTPAHGLFYQPYSLHLEAYSYVDYVETPDDLHSAGGYCIYLGYNSITWNAKKHRIASHSSTEAEYCQLAYTIAEISWLRSLFKDLSVSLRTLLIWCDNISFISLASNPIFHACTKHLEVDYHYVSDKAVCKELDVSYISVAARDSVVKLGGTTWSVQLGRRDATTASFDDAQSNLPSPSLDLSGLISAFSKKGFTAPEMVTLSGGHTIGQVKCSIIRPRIYNETNIDSNFAASIKKNCPSTGGDTNLSPLDQTAGVFDNTYFKDLVNKKGLMHSDQQLFNGGSTDSQVNTYSQNSAKFFSDFGSAMIKMGNLSPLTGSKGEIRTNCRKTN